MQRWLIAVLLIIAAMVCYWFAGMMGIGILIVAGLVFELFFWRELFGKYKNRKKPD